MVFMNNLYLPCSIGVFCGLLVSTVSCVAEYRPVAEPDWGSFRRTVHQAVWDRVISGASFWAEHKGQASHGAYGFSLKVPQKERVTEGTLFDVASLTKVVATTPAVMRLIEQGRVELESPVQRYIPEFTGSGRELITVRQLLVHTSGLPAGIPREPAWLEYDTGIRLACESVPKQGPDVEFRYSDINFILLGEVVRRVSGLPLDEFARKEIFEPLGMKDTLFNPPVERRPGIAATEKDESGVMLRGVVHDPTARRMGGVAGHAGLFSTAENVARYARMILKGGELDGVRLYKEETVQLMTKIHTPPGMVEERALGWDAGKGKSSPRGGFPERGSFGHTGFTGTCMWLDPGSQTYYIFLGSRLHETDPDSSVRKLYEKLGTAVSAAVGYDPPLVPGTAP